MTLSQLSPKGQAVRLITTVVAPLTVCLACYAPAFAQAEKEEMEIVEENAKYPSPRPSVIGYLA